MNVVTTDIYDTWFRKLKRKDPRTAARIQMRVDRLICGNPGDAEPVGGGLSELRIHHGPGYRGVLQATGRHAVDCSAAATSPPKARDIERAHEIAKEWESSGKD